MFYRRINDELVEAPGAKEVSLPDFPDDQFFAVRVVDPLNDPEKEYKSPPKIWIVCVAETGYRVAYGETKDKAIQNANDLLVAYKAVFDKTMNTVTLTTQSGTHVLPGRCCN